jgi:hypothetical protein
MKRNGMGKGFILWVLVLTGLAFRYGVHRGTYFRFFDWPLAGSANQIAAHRQNGRFESAGIVFHQ